VLLTVRTHGPVQCGPENDIDPASSHALSIKAAVRSNFYACVRFELLIWIVRHLGLGGITSSKDTLDGSWAAGFRTKG